MSPLGLGLGFGASSSESTGQSLSELQTICQDHGWQDRSTEGNQALRRFINRTLQLLVTLAPWPEYHKRDGTFTTVSTTFAYVLSETLINKIGSVYRADSTIPLVSITLDEWIKFKNTIGSTGAPTQYALRKFESDGDVKVEMLLYPTPTSAIVITYPYWKMPAELVQSSDRTDWPDNRLWLLEEALEIRIASIKRDSAAVALESLNFLALVEKALGHSMPSYMPIPVQQKITTRGRSIRNTAISITT